MAMSRSIIKTVQTGAKYSLDFKKYSLSSQNKIQSFFHDCSLNLNPDEKTVSMIVEIPRMEQGKFEISTKLPGNPIVQDTKKGKLRFINNIFPFMGYPVNYGALPQTWEDKTHKIEIPFGKKWIEAYGDNDPLDVCEIGDHVSEIGEIKQVKILGCLAMIDENELDWKLLAISKDHELSSKLNDLQDVEHHMPNLLANLKIWFKNYKLPMNKPENEFGYEDIGDYNGWLGPEFAWDVINKCHMRWKYLVNEEIDADELPTIANWSLKDTPGFNSNKLKVDHPSEVANSIPCTEDKIYYYKT